MKREPKKTETLEVRLPPETKAAFMAACRADGVSASGVVRGFIHRYLRSASRASTQARRELEMPYLLKFRGLGAAAGALGLVAASAALVSVGGPARAAADPGLAAMFDLLDRDRDGRISAAEFMAPPAETPRPSGVELIVETRAPPVPGETREALFARLDSGGDGALGLAELDAAVVARTVPTPALAAADRDGDGALTEAELAAFLAAERGAAGIADPSAGIAQLARSILAEHDADQDGRILIADLAG